MKKCFALILFAALLFAFSAAAATYINAAERINFYYQYDGAPADSPGKWDQLLADRLYKLYGHDSIYMNSSTSKYLTGRGCGLFAFSHAYQFLTGRAENDTQMANILYSYLSRRPRWQNTDSSTSPPNAASIYASFLKSLPGVTSYSTSSLDSFDSLSSFFNGGKGVLIVNAPGHYIIAVGVTTYNGTQCVQVVDSIITGTIRTGRLTVGRSIDFSTVYTPSNAADYAAPVHQYWITYSQFKSMCKVKYAFKCSTIPGQSQTEEPQIVPAKSSITLLPGTSERIVISNSSSDMYYTSTDTSVCTVDNNGNVTGVAAGTASVVVNLKSNPQNYATVNVTVYELRSRVVLTGEGRFTCKPVLPDGLLSMSEMVIIDCPGIYTVQTIIKNADGEELFTVESTGIYPDPATTFTLPAALKRVGADAFAGTAAVYYVLPEGIKAVDGRAFDDTAAEAVIIMDPEAVIDPPVSDSIVVYQAGVTD